MLIALQKQMHRTCFPIANSTLLRPHATYRHYDDRLRSKDARFDIPVPNNKTLKLTVAHHCDACRVFRYIFRETRMTSLKPYRPFRFPLYPGRISTIHRAPARDIPRSDHGRFSSQLNGGQSVTPPRLLIIEDQQNKSRALSALLQSWGYLTETQIDLTLNPQQHLQKSYDLILINGYINDETCRLWQAITLDDTFSILIFSQSIEDYNRLNLIFRTTSSSIPPDWQVGELRQKIFRAIDTNSENVTANAEFSSRTYVYRFSGWTVDLEQHVLLNDQGDTIILSAGEFSLLRVFIQYPRRILTRNQILDLTTSMGSDVTDRVIDTQICRLRRRLTAGQDFIRTIRNEGYMFTEDVRRIVSG